MIMRNANSQHLLSIRDSLRIEVIRPTIKLRNDTIDFVAKLMSQMSCEDNFLANHFSCVKRAPHWMQNAKAQSPEWGHCGCVYRVCTAHAARASHWRVFSCIDMKLLMPTPNSNWKHCFEFHLPRRNLDFGLHSIASPKLLSKTDEIHCFHYLILWCTRVQLVYSSRCRRRAATDRTNEL